MTRRRRHFTGIVLGIVILGTLMSGISLIPDPSGTWPYVIAGAAFLVALLTQPLGTLFEGWVERRRKAIEVERRAERAPERDRVRDWTDGRELGVRRAKRPDAQEEPLPAYVPRAFDAALDRAILAGGLVVLEGESVSGKTRSAYEAIRRSVPDRRLIVPSDEQSLAAIADLPTAPRNSVVWLDGVDRYLAAGTLNEGVLDRLCPPDRTDVCIVATLDSRVRRDFPEQSGPTVARILEDRAEHFFVERRLTGAEVEKALEHAGDRRISQALSDQAKDGFAADISGAHTALRRWRSAVHGHDVRAGAVISAAVDARRLGYRDPLPQGLLEDLHRHYLAPNAHHAPGTSTFDEALRWAADPAGGATACLSRVDEGTYEPFHHLVSHALQETDGAEVPEVVWTLVSHRIPAAYLPTFGFAAYETGRFTVAEHAWARFLERSPEHPEANLGMALLALRADDRAGALPSLRRAVADEDPRAMAHLGAVLARITLEGEDPSVAEEAGDWLRRSHDAGGAVEAYLAGLLAYRVKDGDRALFWFNTAAKQRDENAMFLHACLETWGIDVPQLRSLLDEVLDGEKEPEKLAELLADLPHGRAEWSGERSAFRACKWGRKAAIAGNVHAMYLMGRSLEAEGRWRSALVLHKGAVEKGSLASVRRVPSVYKALKQRRRARAWKDAVARTAVTGAAISGVTALAEWHYRDRGGISSGDKEKTVTVAFAVESNSSEEQTFGLAKRNGGPSPHRSYPSSRGSASSSESSSSYGSSNSSSSSSYGSSNSSSSSSYGSSNSSSSSSYGSSDSSSSSSYGNDDY
ncbi:sel1 repeat family protein [Nocardiopsis tropica]|uniref:Sel1 repeat family protein n=1 Tax=Nocardiopsis tropica TaxID=109330 RepID=A0ABU7KPB0_9ACTN|nr:sel1 repeat family protein [Nocardiopsis umidischolae]MEE2051129.1 sel1 repeat family protein [Nocardiopsis umidischolae]